MVRMARRRPDGGFTLIELLVVLVIIGLIAAIALPIFFSQKSKAYDTQVRAQAPNVAKSVETLFTDGATGTVQGTSDTSTVSITSTGVSQPVSTTKAVMWSVTGSQTAYCIATWSADGTKYTADHPLLYDSTKGGTLPDGQSCASGNPSTAGVGSPVDPTAWVWVNVMASSICGKTADGRAFCWGGIEAAPYSTTNPILVAEPALVAIKSASAQHYLLADGTVQTKGSNYWGTLGNGKDSSYTSSGFEPVSQSGARAGKTLTAVTNDSALTSAGARGGGGEGNNGLV